MEILSFLKLAWPLLCALVAIVGLIVRLQSKVSSNCAVTARLQGHIGELLSFMNKSEITIKNDNEAITRLLAAVEKAADRNERTVERIWEKLEELSREHSNRLTALEAKKNNGS